MKKVLSALSFSFFLFSIAEAASIALEDPAFYRSNTIIALPPQVQLYSDPKEGYIDTIFRDKALTQQAFGIPGEHCVIRKLYDSFLYKESGTKWFGVDLNLPQENLYGLHFNFVNASRRSARVNTPLPIDYVLTHEVLLRYKSPDGIVHSIRLNRNQDSFDLRLGPKSFLEFKVSKGDLCDAVEVLIHESFADTLSVLGISLARMQKTIDCLGTTLGRLRRKSAKSGVPEESATASEAES